MGARKLDRRRDRHSVVAEVLWRQFVDHHNSLGSLRIHFDFDCNTLLLVLDHTQGLVGCHTRVEFDSDIADCMWQHRDLLGYWQPIPCHRMVASPSCDAVEPKGS